MDGEGVTLGEGMEWEREEKEGREKDWKVKKDGNREANEIERERERESQ